jgi:RHO1 GDP-GTP exchange protein 1/2
MAPSAGMGLHPKSAEDPEELQNLYNQVWAAFTEEESSANDSDLDNIYGGYADDGLNDITLLSRVPQAPQVPPKRA